jgi:hypothetical protein
MLTFAASSTCYLSFCFKVTCRSLLRRAGGRIKTTQLTVYPPLLLLHYSCLAQCPWTFRGRGGATGLGHTGIEAPTFKIRNTTCHTCCRMLSLSAKYTYFLLKRTVSNCDNEQTRKSFTTVGFTGSFSLIQYSKKQKLINKISCTPHYFWVRPLLLGICLP